MTEFIHNHIYFSAFCIGWAAADMVTTAIKLIAAATRYIDRGGL